MWSITPHLVTRVAASTYTVFHNLFRDLFIPYEFAAAFDSYRSIVSMHPEKLSSVTYNYDSVPDPSLLIFQVLALWTSWSFLVSVFSHTQTHVDFVFFSRPQLVYICTSFAASFTRCLTLMSFDLDNLDFKTVPWDLFQNRIHWF